MVSFSHLNGFTGERLTFWTMLPCRHRVRLGFACGQGWPCHIELPVTKLASFLLSIWPGVQPQTGTINLPNSARKHALGTVALLFDKADMACEAASRRLCNLIQLLDRGDTWLHVVQVDAVHGWEGLDHPQLATLRPAAGEPVVILHVADVPLRTGIDTQLRITGAPLRCLVSDVASAPGTPDDAVRTIDDSAKRVFARLNEAGWKPPAPPIKPGVVFEDWALEAPRRVRPDWRLVTAGLLFAIVSVGAALVDWQPLPPEGAAAISPAPATALPPIQLALYEQAPAAIPPIAEPPDAALPVSLQEPPWEAPRAPGMPTRAAIFYEQGDPGAEAAARTVAIALRRKGFTVGEPAPVHRRAVPSIAYFFARDAGAANAVRQSFADITGQPIKGELTRRAPLPAPGTVELMVAGR